MSLDPVFQQALSLSPEDRVRPMDQLIRSVVAPPCCDELDQEQKAELLRRLAEDDADPDSAISWDEVLKQLKRSA
jgi:putative addiction module component (TIGR02574 family)